MWDSEPLAFDEDVKNRTDGADPMWHTAAQAIQAGSVRTVNFTMYNRRVARKYREPFKWRMQEVVPSSMVADGGITVSSRRVRLVALC